MRSIVLSGFMATGKSTIGPELAARLGLPFVDTDDVIAREAGAKTVGEVWTRDGEVAFRAREAKLVARLFLERDACVYAFGGGTMTMRETRHFVLDRATVITLTAAPETVVARVADVNARPNLAVTGDPLARARQLIEDRADAYAECHATLSTDGTDVDAVVDAAVALIERAPLVMPLGTRSYAIDVAHDQPTLLTDAIAACAPSSLVVVTDATVQRARGAALDAALARLAIPSTRVTLAPGESQKTLASASAIWDAALGARIDRDALVVAFGGGVVGDLAGFAAATVLRGIRFLQVPTTLLAMVDSSVGGKTGFDHPAGKNLIGAFHQPSGVVVDLAHLKTLAPRERNSGLAEIVKIALTHDSLLFAALERDAEALAAGDEAVLAPVVRAAIAAKIRVVRDDETERGARALLNLGHTIGHALESHGNYRKYLHGEAVAIGTLLEIRAAAALQLTPHPIVDRVAALLARLGLPHRVPPLELAGAWGFIASDKKRRGDLIQLPVLTDVGASRVARVSLLDLRRAAM